MQFGRFLGRVAGFGARALPAVQRFGNTAGEYLHKGSMIGARAAKLARSGLDAIERSDLGRVPGVGELIGVGRDATNVLDMASRAAGRAGDVASRVVQSKELRGLTTQFERTSNSQSEALPDHFKYNPRPVAPPAEMIRHYLKSTAGGAPQTGGAKAEFSIPCSNPGLHLDPSQTVLSFQINNNNTGPMTLDGGAHAIVQSINVFLGSVHISSIDKYGAIFALTQDFTTDLDSLRSSGTVRCVADFSPVAVAISANIKDAYYSRNGATIAAATSSFTSARFVSMDGAVERAMMDSLSGIVHCPTLDYSHFRSTMAPNAGFISMQIPICVSQACNIFVVLRESAVTNGFSREMISQRTKAEMIDYRFRVGATVIPQTAINCTGSAAEARFELARTFGSGVSDAAARSCISAEQFLTDGRSRRLMRLSDGISTRNMHVVLESKISASNPACYLDVWVQHEKTSSLKSKNQKHPGKIIVNNIDPFILKDNLKIIENNFYKSQKNFL
ncbi:hypothetical protein T492DRAFT_832015 [Pavlovales sp. CCMP2436]|nr:hypothetical protein T492DRAFT_832015 [Pavlovales sp. CCMP2436]